MKKKNILIGILCLSALYACKDEVPGKGILLYLKPNTLYFEYKNDTMIVSASKKFMYLTSTSTTTDKVYFNKDRDTLYDGWIKAVASKDRMEVKVIVYDNDTELDRHYEIEVSTENTEETLRVIQRAKNL